ncbi:hypothetical protein ICW40_04050, partial [Actinotalea ferrariae]|nr:hypothetical protein [Actinotalea ferrariae]
MSNRLVPVTAAVVGLALACGAAAPASATGAGPDEAREAPWGASQPHPG